MTWINTNLDQKLQKYLTMYGVHNLDDVKSVHAIGLGYNLDEDDNPMDSPKIVHHRIFNFVDLQPEYDNYFLEYHRIIVVFKNGNTVAWNFFPSEWESIDEIFTLELSSAE